MSGNNSADLQSRESIAYIRQMLGELRLVAEREGAPMLCYLIGMAFEEAVDLQRHQMGRSVRKAQ
jgi:hypothetical protein